MTGTTIWSITSPTYSADFVEYPDQHHELRGWFTTDKLVTDRHGGVTTINLGQYIPDVSGIATITDRQVNGDHARVQFVSAGPIMRLKAPAGDTPLERLKSVLATPAARDAFVRMFGKQRAEAILLNGKPIETEEAKLVAGRWRVDHRNLSHPRTP